MGLRSLHFIDMVFIGVGLSMDAAAVTIANRLGRPGVGKGQLVQMALAFGLFQGIMPVLGYFAGSLFAELISRYSGIVTFLILGAIGGSMIKEGLSAEEENDSRRLNLSLLLVQAVATSIAAFAVGVSFCAEAAPIGFAAPVIAATTFGCSLLAGALAAKAGPVLGSRAQLLGGAILVAIGLKALL